MRPRWLLVACCALLVVQACSAGARKPASRPRGPGPTPVSASYLLDGRPVSGSVRVTARSHLRVAFGAQVPPAMLKVALDGKAVSPDALGWAGDLLSVEIPFADVLPYRPVKVAVGGGPGVADPGPLELTMVATVPANATTGVQPGFQPRTPIEIVVENSGAARPQSGLQDADLVYEYISEYGITRMTAMYFAGIPSMVGPVRSCRMVNPYLGYAYAGVTMCSGVSDGTGGYMVGTTPGSRAVPNVMEPRDWGAHFFRVGFRAVPHNAYTSGDRAGLLRSEVPQPPGDYAVDPPHQDALAGAATGAAWVPQHGVAYAYDPGSAQYLRTDHGSPFVDQGTGQQLRVKNVVQLHVPFHDAGWIEDDNGGAHSVWYDMLGSGPAEIWSDGLALRATWHMGAAGQNYFDNHTPVWFTDEAGHQVLLNTGLTWIHVLGDGQ